MKLRDKSLTREEVKLSDDEVNVLGPSLVLDDCKLLSDCQAEALVIAGMSMKGGSFIQKRRLSSFHFENAHFSRVSFAGTFVGCDFGDWDSRDTSSIDRCTFADATLDGCRFLNCEPGTMRFPSWPGFTILKPIEARTFVLANKWPAKLRTLLDIYTDSDEACSAVCGDAMRIATEDKISLSELKNMLERIPGIVIHG